METIEQNHYLTTESSSDSALISPGAYEINKRIATTVRNSLKGEGKTDFFFCSVNGKMGALLT